MRTQQRFSCGFAPSSAPLGKPGRPAPAPLRRCSCCQKGSWTSCCMRLDCRGSTAPDAAAEAEGTVDTDAAAHDERGESSLQMQSVPPWSSVPWSCAVATGGVKVGRWRCGGKLMLAGEPH